MEESIPLAHFHCTSIAGIDVARLPNCLICETGKAFSEPALIQSLAAPNPAPAGPSLAGRATLKGNVKSSRAIRSEQETHVGMKVRVWRKIERRKGAVKNSQGIGTHRYRNAGGLSFGAKQTVILRFTQNAHGAQTVFLAM
jgi:hypothetical protein